MRPARFARPPRSRGAGFSLAEVAVTIAIVAITVLACYQGLDGSMLTAAQTRNMKVARELAQLTLGQVESGLYWEEIESGIGGSYAEEGYPSFYYEIALGDDQFIDVDTSQQRFDSWAYQTELREQRLLDEGATDEEIDEQEQSFEEVRVRVTFDSVLDFSNEVILERWIPWEQVYGPDEERDSSGEEVASDV